MYRQLNVYKHIFIWLTFESRCAENKLLYCREESAIKASVMKFNYSLREGSFNKLFGSFNKQSTFNDSWPILRSFNIDFRYLLPKHSLYNGIPPWKFIVITREKRFVTSSFFPSLKRFFIPITAQRRSSFLWTFFFSLFFMRRKITSKENVKFPNRKSW